MRVSSALRTKWAATAASMWIQCTSGSSYCFSIYSPLLKSSQAYDQSTLDSVAFFKDVGANFGVLSGLLLSSSSRWVVIAAGAVQCFVGYFCVWMSVTGMVPRPPVGAMCLYTFLAAHAQTFFNTADVVTAVQNFPGNRGTAVGIMKGFLGLSGAILIKIYHTMYAGEASNFILMLALLPSLLPLLLMFFVNVYHKRGEDDKKYLNGFSIISLIIAAYLMVLIIWENVLPLNMVTRVITFALLLLLLCCPLWTVASAHVSDSAIMLIGSSSDERTQLIDEIDALERLGQRVAGHHNNNIHHREDINILQAMKTAEFWLLFISMACGMGSGLATVNNISQIGGSLDYTSVEISTMVSLWSIWNFLGRFGAGYTSDYFLNSRGFARPLFIAITLATMSIGHCVIASGLPGALYVGSVLVGVCYGCQWSLMPTISSELFGVMHMGTIFNTISIASPLGSYILSVRVVGYMYDTEAASSGMKTCIGVHCFRLSFLIMASICLIGFVVALVLFFRTRKFYEHLSRS